MDIFDGYKPEEGTRLEKGDHRVKITEAEIKVSTRGNQMVALKFITKEGSKLFMNVSQGDYFNRIMTNFYDGFGIQRGDRNMRAWIGKTATAHIDLGKPRESDGKQFMEVKYFFTQAPQNGANANPYGQPPQGAPTPRQSAPVANSRQSAELDKAANSGWNAGRSDDGFVDDIPGQQDIF